jgi:tape measure domain-containing protein
MKGFKGEVQSGVKGAFGGLGSLASGAGAAIATGFKVAGAAAGALGVAVGIAGFKFNSMKQQAMIAFTTMLGSGKKAKVFLDDLQSFAAKTPFEFPELVKSSQRLLAMGFQAKEIIPTMTSIGDAVAGLGGSAETLGRVTTALGQIQAKGKASAEEMLQLTESGIPAWRYLADAIGTSIPEAMKKVSKGAVDSKTTIDAVLAGMNKSFGGMMEKQSHTFAGLLSTLKDTFSIISGKIMQPFFDMATKGMAKLADVVSKPAFTQGVERFTSALASGVGKALDLVLGLVGKLAPVGKAAFEGIRGVVDRVAPAIMRIGETMEGMVVPVFEALGRIGRAALSAIEAAITKVLPTLVEIVAVLASHLVPIFEKVGIIAVAAFRSIAGVIADHREELVRIAQRVGAIASALSAVLLPVLKFVFTQVLPTAIGIAITAIDKISGAVEGVITFFRGMPGKIVGFFSTLANELYQVALKITLKIIEPFTHLPSFLGGWARKAKEAVEEKLAQVKLERMSANLAAQVRAAGSSAASVARAVGILVGSGLTEGAAAGILASAERMRAAAVDAVDRAKNAAIAASRSRSPSKEWEEDVGKPLGEGVIRGWLISTMTLPSKVSDRLREAVEKGREVIERARDRFASIFESLSGRIVRAFDAESAAFETASQRRLREIDERRQTEDLLAREVEARRRLEEAQNSEGVSADELARLKMDLARATEDVEMASLRRQAEQERIQFDSRREEQRLFLEKRLKAIGAGYEKEGGTVKGALKKIRALMDAFDIDFETAGSLLGTAFVGGLKKEVNKAAAAAATVSGTVNQFSEAIATQVAKGKIKMFAGGVRNFTGGWGIVGERGPELLNLPRGSDVVPLPAGDPLGTMSATLSQVLGELRKQTFLAERGQVLQVAVSGGNGATFNDIAVAARR